MKKKKSLPKIQFKYFDDVPEDFTGICYVLKDKVTCHFKNGVLHREGEPAFVGESKMAWFLNGKLHREDGPASIQYGREEFALHGKLMTKAELEIAKLAMKLKNITTSEIAK